MNQVLKEHFDSETLILNEGQEKNIYIVGPFLQHSIPNRNGRIYPEEVLQPQVESYVENYVRTNRAVGEAEHPDTSRITFDRISHLITEIEQDGNNFMGKAKLLGTPMGLLCKSLVEGGVKLGVSSRGSGSVKRRRDGLNEVQKDYKLATVDIVYAPSGRDCFVDTIVESEVVETLLRDHALLHEFEMFLAARENIKRAQSPQRLKMSIDAFEAVIKGLKV